MIRISVVIPTYKPASYLWQCLESISKQTLPNTEYEIIVVLNGCDKPWKEQITDYIQRFLSNNQIVLLQTDISGVSNARNMGIRHAKGEFISFLDDDDYVSPDYLLELLHNSGRTTVAISNTLSFINGSNSPTPYHITNNYEKLKDLNETTINRARSFFSGPCMKLIHRDIIGDNCFNTLLSNGEDTLFMFEISNKIKYVKSTSEKAIYYRRIREQSATTAYRGKKEKRKSDIIQLKAILRSYIRHPFEYNFFFFISRIVGCIYYIIRPV